MANASKRPKKSKPTSYAIDVLIDTYRDTIARLLVEQRARLHMPVHRLVLWFDSDSGFLPSELLFYDSADCNEREKGEITLEISVPDSAVPYSTYVLEERRDPLVRAFYKATGLMTLFDASDDYGWWGQANEAPAILLQHGFAQLLEDLPAMLKNAEIPLDADFRAGRRMDGEEEVEYPDRKAIEVQIATSMSGRFDDSEALQAFACLCYDGAHAQRWLASLGKKPKKTPRRTRVTPARPQAETPSVEELYDRFGNDAYEDHNVGRILLYVKKWETAKPIAYRGDILDDSFTVPSRTAVFVTGDITLNGDLILEQQSILVVNGTLRARHVLATSSYFAGRAVDLSGIFFGEGNGDEDGGGDLGFDGLNAQAIIDFHADFGWDGKANALQIVAAPGRRYVDRQRGKNAHYTAKRLGEILRPEVLTKGKFDAMKLRARLLGGEPVLLTK